MVWLIKKNYYYPHKHWDANASHALHGSCDPIANVLARVGVSASQALRLFTIFNMLGQYCVATRIRTRRVAGQLFVGAPNDEDLIALGDSNPKRDRCSMPSPCANCVKKARIAKAKAKKKAKSKAATAKAKARAKAKAPASKKRKRLAAATPVVSVGLGVECYFPVVRKTTRVATSVQQASVQYSVSSALQS